MRAPRFWLNPPGSPGLIARLLWPLSAIYAGLTAARLRKGPGYRASIPVICVGNINAGGTGKTPMVIALIEILRARGVEPHVVTRGFGGSMQGPVQVIEGTHTAAQSGDEPLLLAAFAPVWVAKDRAAGVKAAEAAGAHAIILDDGFQNPTVAKDLSLVVVDAHMGFGNGRVLPAGPLREPVNVGLTRADLLISIGIEPAQRSFLKRWPQSATVPHATAHLEILPTGMPWRDLPVLAFAGIGYPEKFFGTLRHLGADIIRSEALSDHQPLTEALMNRLEAEAAAKGAQLVTTEKDAVRLPDRFRTKVLTLPVRLKIDQPDVLNQALDRLTFPSSARE